MTITIGLATLVALAALVAFLYWALILTEGAYLGERVVVWLYDVYAHRYDRIKRWDIDDEITYLALPFAAAVGAVRTPPLILDVAAGTGRLMRAVEAAGKLPDARWVLLDASDKMLAQARRECTGGRVHFIRHSAQQLPFPDASFDVVTCLEALEFMPDPAGVLVELARVLRPGGFLLVTNRIGNIRWFMPRRTWSHNEIYRLLKELGMKRIDIRPFLLDYEWVGATKPGVYMRPGRADDPEMVRRLEGQANIG